MAETQSALLSDEETEQLIRCMDTIRGVQRIMAACLETGTELLAQMTEIAARHNLKVHSGGELIPLRLPDDVTPPARRSQD